MLCTCTSTGSRGLQRFAQHRACTNVIGQQQHEPCIHGMALVQRQTTVGLNQGLVKIVCRFEVVTPTWFTSEGSCPVALETRFCTFTAAMSGSVPFLK